MKAIVIITLLGIFASLGQALYAMSSGPGNAERMARALTVRIVLSVALFLLLMLGWYLDFLEPHV